MFLSGTYALFRQIVQFSSNICILRFPGHEFRCKKRMILIKSRFVFTRHRNFGTLFNKAWFDFRCKKQSCFVKSVILNETSIKFWICQCRSFSTYCFYVGNSSIFVKHGMLNEASNLFECFLHLFACHI